MKSTVPAGLSGVQAIAAGEYHTVTLFPQAGIPSSVLTGTILTAQLPSTVARRDQANTFNGNQIVANGNVGIGTLTPTARLDVNGQVKATAFVGSIDATNIVGLGVARTDQANVFTANQSIVSGNVRVNDYDILLSTGNDNAFGLGVYAASHGKTFAGASPDGPVLYGFAGGALGTSNQTLRTQSLALVWKNDWVGIWTTDPTARLDVRGDIKLGAQGQYYAVAAEENVRILYGVVNANGTPNSGSPGWSVQRLGTGHYEIQFSTAFASIPAVLVNAAFGENKVCTVWTTGINSAQILINSAATQARTDSAFTFSIFGRR